MTGLLGYQGVTGSGVMFGAIHPVVATAGASAAYPPDDPSVRLT
jgi:hypothetical protein